MRATTERSDAESLGRASAGGMARRANAVGAAGERGADPPAAVAQRRLEGLANRSAQAQRTAGYQSMLNGSPSVAALQRKQQAASAGPKGGELEEDKKRKRTAQLAAASGQHHDQADDLRKKKVQRKAVESPEATVQRAAEPAQPNHTGLPDGLKTGVESLSGVSMDDVRVHYNSPKPAALQAHAYTQGTEIHVAPGQERHLPHEAWHAAQQKQGRVPVTAQLKGVGLNDDAALEREADQMGEAALRAGGARRAGAEPLHVGASRTPMQRSSSAGPSTVQRTGSANDKVLVAQRKDAGATPKATAEHESEPKHRFLVEQAGAPGPGQVSKDEFLAALKKEVYEVAAEVLARIGQTPDNCPYIHYWFAYYEGKDASHVEQAIARFAPEAATAKDWRGYAAKIGARVRQGFEKHVATGSLEGVPEDVPKDLLAKEAQATQKAAPVKPGAPPAQRRVAEGSPAGVIQMCWDKEKEPEYGRLEDGGVELGASTKRRVDGGEYDLVGMNRVASSQGLLATHGLNNCVALVAYDTVARWAAFTHFNTASAGELNRYSRASVARVKAQLLAELGRRNRGLDVGNVTYHVTLGDTWRHEQSPIGGALQAARQNLNAEFGAVAYESGTSFFAAFDPTRGQFRAPGEIDAVARDAEGNWNKGGGAELRA